MTNFILIFERIDDRTLDRTDATGNTNRGRHRLHKRSILKHHSKEGDKSAREGGGPVKMDIRPTNMKVKFAGSLRQIKYSCHRIIISSDQVKSSN